MFWMLNTSVYEQFHKQGWEGDCASWQHNHNVLLLSLAEIEGVSVLTWCIPLPPISRPWKRPRGSCCIVSGRACPWPANKRRWGVNKLSWREWNCCICMFWDSLGPDCVWWEKNADWLYGMCCIPKLYASEEEDISPVAILSLSTSCFSASFRAVI